MNKHQTVRGDVTKFTPFKPLTDKKLVDTTRIKNARAPPTDIPLRPEVKAFLSTVGWSQDQFIIAYSHVFDTMSSLKPIDRNMRFSTYLPIRLFSMSGLNWTSQSKNRVRDWDKVALAVVVEAALVESYRETLLKECPLARQLRQELQDFFFSITPPWKQIDSSVGAMTIVTDKKWIFPDNIYVNAPVDDEIEDVTPPVDPTTLRSEFQVLTSKKSASKKKSRKKVTAPPQSTPSAPTAPEKGTAPISKGASTIATKDNPTHKRSDDIQSLLSSLKSIQKHKLLQCSDPDAPSGSTESIVSFAASVIGHVCILSPVHSRYTLLMIVL